MDLSNVLDKLLVSFPLELNYLFSITSIKITNTNLHQVKNHNAYSENIHYAPKVM
jgi:hypothetical protein